MQGRGCRPARDTLGTGVWCARYLNVALEKYSVFLLKLPKIYWCIAQIVTKKQVVMRKWTWMRSHTITFLNFGSNKFGLLPLILREKRKPPTLVPLCPRVGAAAGCVLCGLHACSVCPPPPLLLPLLLSPAGSRCFAFSGGQTYIFWYGD